MSESLLLAVAQPPCLRYNVAANVLTHAETVVAASARVVLFPELSLTGYELDAEAITPDDPRLSPLVDACAITGTVALVGAPIRGEHIATLAVDGTGVSVAYRKLYLDVTEARRFSPGERPGVIEVDGWRLGLGICKDTGIAQHAADTAALGIDAYLAGTLMHAPEKEIQDQRGRRTAAEHRIWVAFASFAEPTGGGFASPAGCSGIWAPGGELVAQAGPDTGDLARATLAR